MSTPSSEARVRRALVSVHDKSGVVEFARALADEFGVEILSTGGTASLLRDAGVPVTLVEQVTGFPELMDGRVKTLHPNVHAGILADRDNPEHMRQLARQGIQPIDMVVVNLYPFRQTIARPECTFASAIEMIDVGGPCMLRAAAKNHRHVLVVCDPSRYSGILGALRHWTSPTVRDTARHQGALAAFEITSAYDRHIHEWLSTGGEGRGPTRRTLELWSTGPLRYGENPHQRAERLVFSRPPAAGAPSVAVDGEGGAEVALSFNNLVDADAAIELCRDLERAGDALLDDEFTPPGPGVLAACVFVKHTNACGVGVSRDPVEAYRRAYLGDPNAAMGGVLCCNFAVDTMVADEVMHTFERLGKSAGAGGFFVEVWAAPAFGDDAVQRIRTLKPWGRRVRLLPVPSFRAPPAGDEWDYRRVEGGMLAQTRDSLGLGEDQWTIATTRPPSSRERRDLRIAWLIAKHTKSNAISLCRDGALLGNGAGQMSRVMSCRVAVWLASENGHAAGLTGAAAASDAFFPFDDGPRFLLDAGVSAIIQPGGAKRDEEAVKACDERGATMVFTGVRHFRH